MGTGPQVCNTVVAAVIVEGRTSSDSEREGVGATVLSST